MGDPLVLLLIAASILIIVGSIVARLLHNRRLARQSSQRRAELRRQYGFAFAQQQEIERLAERILATSTTGSIPGFIIVRQIDAIFTDGHATPSKAVELLKAHAGEKGANAIINLTSERLGSGKCVARGDAVLVRVEDAGTAGKSATTGAEPVE